MKLLRLILALTCALPAFAQKEALQRAVGTNTVTGSLSSAPFQVATIAALKATLVANSATPNGTSVNVLGYYAAGDGGGGTFQYNSASVATDDGGSVIAPNAGSGRWIRVITGSVNVRWFGVKGDWNGSTGTDDTLALQAAIDFAATIGKVAGVNIYGGAEVYIPAGCRMKTTATLVIPGGQHGFSIKAETQQFDPDQDRFHINYFGSVNLPILTVRFQTSGNFTARLTADATIAAAALSSTTVSIDIPTFLSNGGSIAGKLNIMAGTLSRSGSTYTFTRTDAGLIQNLYAGLDFFQPNSPSSGNATPDRGFSAFGLTLNGNGNAIGILLEGHGSASFFEQVRTANTVIGFRISQPPSNGNNEFITFMRCSFTASQIGLDITDSDAYAIAMYGSDVSIVPTVSADRSFGAAIRLSYTSGMGLSVYGGNIGSSAATTPLGNNAINNIAMLEVTGPGDPIIIDGVRVEHCGVGVRYIKGDSSVRAVTVKNSHFTNMPGHRIQLFKASTAYPTLAYFSSGGNTYTVLAAGTSAATGPTSTDGSVETNGTMSVRYVGADNSANNWLTWAKIVDCTSPQAVSGIEPAVGFRSGNVEFYNCEFSSRDFNQSTDNTGLTTFVVGSQNRVSFLGCSFEGRTFEFNPQAGKIVRERCMIRGHVLATANPWSPPSLNGPKVNLLLDNSDPSTSNWTRGASTSSSRLDPNDTFYMPYNGGQGWRFTSTAPYDVAASQIKQTTGISATALGQYVARGSQARFEGNNQLYVKLVDGNGFMLGGAIIAQQDAVDFEVPFDTGASNYSGSVVFVVSSIEGVGSASSTNRILRPQITHRNFPTSYVQTGIYPVDESVGAYSGKEVVSYPEIHAQGRLIIPTTARGALQTTKWGQRDGDMLIDSNRRLTLNMGDAWTTTPRTFHQSGLTAPTTGIWRVGDQILRTDPTANEYIGIVCTTAGGFVATGGFAPVDYAAWASTTGVQDGAFRYTSGNRIYRCLRAGTTSSSEPTHTSGVAADGTVYWEFEGNISAPTFKGFGLLEP